MSRLDPQKHDPKLGPATQEPLLCACQLYVLGPMMMIQVRTMEAPSCGSPAFEVDVEIHIGLAKDLVKGTESQKKLKISVEEHVRHVPSQNSLFLCRRSRPGSHQAELSPPVNASATALSHPELPGPYSIQQRSPNGLLQTASDYRSVQTASPRRLPR